MVNRTEDHIKDNRDGALADGHSLVEVPPLTGRGPAEADRCVEGAAQPHVSHFLRQIRSNHRHGRLVLEQYVLHRKWRGGEAGDDGAPITRASGSRRVVLAPTPATAAWPTPFTSRPSEVPPRSWRHPYPL
jgi:hypothetical protein